MVATAGNLLKAIAGAHRPFSRLQRGVSCGWSFDGRWVQRRRTTRRAESKRRRADADADSSTSPLASTL